MKKLILALCLISPLAHAVPVDEWCNVAVDMAVDARLNAHNGRNHVNAWGFREMERMFDQERTPFLMRWSIRQALREAEIQQPMAQMMETVKRNCLEIMAEHHRSPR